MIYVVTRSDGYYPCAGATDWEFVTRDRQAAMERARGLYGETPDRIMGGGKIASVHVLAIDEDNLHVQEIEVLS